MKDWSTEEKNTHSTKFTVGFCIEYIYNDLKPIFFLSRDDDSIVDGHGDYLKALRIPLVKMISKKVSSAYIQATVAELHTSSFSSRSLLEMIELRKAHRR
jgi:hypothetical protein